jgi:predicted enzyme related to lactoylglutathione lyase
VPVSPTRVRATYEPAPQPVTLASVMDKSPLKEKLSADMTARRLMDEVPQIDRRVGTSDTSLARHHVVWFDIPARDIDRAVRFYSAVLGVRLKKEQAGPGSAIALLPHGEGFIGGCLVQSMDARPSESGPLLYLNTQGRLDEAVIMVERQGGKVLVGRHSIEPFGFRAIILDSEGNRIALHTT